MAIALVAHPALGRLAAQLGDALPVTGLYYPARSRPKDATLPFFADLSAMLEETGARTCAFLSPYEGLAKDIDLCLAIGVDVLCAGPLPGSAPVEAADGRLQIGGVHRWAPHWAKTRQQRRDPAFGEAVFLRLIAGAGAPGLLPAWWAICRQWALAVDLLGDGFDNLHLSANNKGRAYHIALTASAPGGTIVQLVVAPQASLLEMSLQGTGGHIAVSHAQGGVLLAGAHSTQVMHEASPPAELAWLRAFYAKRDPPDGPPFAHGATLLTGLRRALRQRRPIALKP